MNPCVYGNSLKFDHVQWRIINAWWFYYLWRLKFSWNLHFFLKMYQAVLWGLNGLLLYRDFFFGLNIGLKEIMSDTTGPFQSSTCFYSQYIDKCSLFFSCWHDNEKISMFCNCWLWRLTQVNSFLSLRFLKHQLRMKFLCSWKCLGQSSHHRSLWWIVGEKFLHLFSIWLEKKNLKWSFFFFLITM